MITQRTFPTCDLPGPEIIKHFMFNSVEHENFLVIHVKMPTIVGILTFMKRKKSILGLSEPENAEFLDSFILMSNENFMLN